MRLWELREGMESRDSYPRKRREDDYSYSTKGRSRYEEDDEDCDDYEEGYKAGYKAAKRKYSHMTEDRY